MKSLSNADCNQKVINKNLLSYIENGKLQYKDLDVAAAKTRMPWFYAEDHEIKWNNNYARILLNPELETYDHVNYFLRKSHEDNDKLLLVGYWKGAAHRVFCELNMNE